MPIVFHRRASPTQTTRDAYNQTVTGQLWGRANRGSDTPSVDGYAGPLPPGIRGTEYETSILPDPGTQPRLVRWTAANSGVIVEGEFARIPVTVTRSTQYP